jgi:hypothetical protein
VGDALEGFPAQRAEEALAVGRVAGLILGGALGELDEDARRRGGVQPAGQRTEAETGFRLDAVPHRPGISQDLLDWPPGGGAHQPGAPPPGIPGDVPPSGSFVPASGSGVVLPLPALTVESASVPPPQWAAPSALPLNTRA